MTIGELFNVLLDIPKFVIRDMYNKNIDIYEGFVDDTTEPEEILNILVHYIGIKDKNTLIFYCDGWDIEDVFE